MSEESVFTFHRFPPIKQELLYKHKLNGLDDKTRYCFVPLTISIAAKSEYKEGIFEDEFINMFLRSAKILANVIQTENIELVKCSSQKEIFLKKYSLALPVLYLTRHCIELSIKKAIRHIGHKPKSIHSLESLWNSFVSYLSKSITWRLKHNDNDEKILKRMHNFVRYIDFLDNNGEKFRYSKENDGQFTQNIFYWVNCVAITAALYLFVDQLNALTNFNEVDADKHPDENDK